MKNGDYVASAPGPRVELAQGGEQGPVQDPDTRRAILAAAKEEILANLQNIREALSSGSLEIEMFHQDKSMGGHCEINVILKGDYLATAHRVHLIATQDWSTFKR